MLKAVVFDFDGTLADTIPIKAEAIGKILEDMKGFKLSRKDYERARDMDFKILLKEARVSIFEIPSFVAKVNSMTGEKVKKANLFKGIRPLLTNLSKRYSLCVISVSKSELVEGFLRNNNLKMFKSVLAKEYLFGKERLIKQLLKDLRLGREEIIYVGDEVRDIIACRKAGVKVISVTWGFNSRKRLIEEKPDSVADEPKDILEILKNMSFSE